MISKGSLMPVLPGPVALTLFLIIVLMVFSQTTRYNRALAGIKSLLKKGR